MKLAEAALNRQRVPGRGIPAEQAIVVRGAEPLLHRLILRRALLTDILDDLRIKRR